MNYFLGYLVDRMKNPCRIWKQLKKFTDDEFLIWESECCKFSWQSNLADDESISLRM